MKRLPIKFTNDAWVSISPNNGAKLEKLKISKGTVTYATPCRLRHFKTTVEDVDIEVCDLDTDDGIIIAVAYKDFVFLDDYFDGGL